MFTNLTYKKFRILSFQSKKKRILVAPLHWGLGHATRCIPIIKALMTYNFEPIIASDGHALVLLKKEFPTLYAVELPSYNVTYSKTGKHFKLKLIKDLPHFLKTIKQEQKFIKRFVMNQKVDGIISDNRFGVRHPTIPSIFITHQLNVLSGNTTWLSSKLHENIIKKFDECWVPDFADTPNLSGALGHPKTVLKSVKYIGALSRFKKQDVPKTIDLLVLLSGPEPQRTQLEKKLLITLQQYNGTTIFIRGIVEDTQIRTQIKENITLFNFMASEQLEKIINQSKLIVSRSGYTTIMDLAKLGKKAIFIPTPGQFEQIYLAKHLEKNGIIPFVNQEHFSVSDLKFNSNYSGFSEVEDSTDYEALFGLF